MALPAGRARGCALRARRGPPRGRARGRSETLLIVTPGGVIGELALLSGAGRSASVRARRDSRLLRLRRADFERVLEDEPAVQRALMATMAAQLAQSVSVSAPSERAVILALVAVNDAAPLQKVAATLEDALSREGPLVRLDSGGTTESEAAAIVESCERSGSRMLLVAGKGASEGAWRAFCLRQADRILALVPPARSPPASSGRPLTRLRPAVLRRRAGHDGGLAGRARSCPAPGPGPRRTAPRGGVGRAAARRPVCRPRPFGRRRPGARARRRHRGVGGCGCRRRPCGQRKHRLVHRGAVRLGNDARRD